MKTKEKSGSDLAVTPASSSTVSTCMDSCSVSNCSNVENVSQEKNLCVTSIEEELHNKFEPKFYDSRVLCNSFYRIGNSYYHEDNEIMAKRFYRKAQAVEQCGTELHFASNIFPNGKLGKQHLYHANFCHDRLCPMCSWRRSLKIFGQVSKIMDFIVDDYKFLFLTLTVKNCTSDKLSDTITQMTSAYNRFMGYKVIQDNIKGFFRCLEITRNDKKGTYHPHFHIILAVSKSYGTYGYIPQKTFLSLWQKAYGDDSITQVHIETFKSASLDSENITRDELSKAVAEACKYTLKASDFLFSDNNNLTDDIVLCLTNALHHRRLCAFGGIFKKVASDLKLEDPEASNANLTDIDDCKLNPSLAWLIVKCGWSEGCYKVIDILEESAELHKCAKTF